MATRTISFDIITIFPEALSYLNESILRRAQKKGLIKIKIHNLRDFSRKPHCQVDDRPYGGGPGMVMKIEPLIKAIQFVKSKIKNQHEVIAKATKSKIKVILFSPAGSQFDNKTAARLAKNCNQLILICGHYEGVDERLQAVLKNLKLKNSKFSIGSYVLTGGELPAMVLIDAVSRHIPGVLGKKESLEEKRLGLGVPTYTRPEIFVYQGRKYKVPKILLSGNHQKIYEWKKRYVNKFRK